MDYIYLAPVEGLFHEFSLPEKLETSRKLAISDNHVLDGNHKFWSELLDETRIYNLVENLENNQHTKWANTPQYISIIADKQRFVNNIMQAKHDLCEHNITPQHFYSCLETLTILCKLYSDLIYYPYTLDLQNGFELKNFSSFNIYEECLNSAKNPYIRFIKKEILPIILQSKPKLLFIEGKISFYNMAIAKFVKKHLPNTHVCVTKHSSEYYSLNKITKYIQNNKLLFKMIDSIILEYFSQTEMKLISAINNNCNNFHDIGNLLFIDHNTGKIELSPTIVPKDTNRIDIYNGSPEQYEDIKISSRQIADVRIEPYEKCHWNKCSFCGINKKYSYQNTEFSQSNFTTHLLQIKKIAYNGVKYLWFIDEALPVFKLRQIAEFFVKENLTFKWQARCRIHSDLLSDGLVDLLKLSGLVELRMGLESASLTVLREMNKFDEDFSLDLVEKIVKSYTEHGISIHFPMIIGFPTENNADRRYTFNFLSKLKLQFPLFTFNINVFQLDVSSSLFKNWSDYSVTKICFPCDTDTFLGNWVNYFTTEQKNSFVAEQDQFMRDELFPWMPHHSLLSPHIFYRLSETVRNTLIWKSIEMQEDSLYFYSGMWLKTEENMTFTYNNLEKTYVIYNWKNHHYVKGNKLLLDVIQEWKKPHSITKGVNHLISNNSQIYTEDDLIVIIKKLIYYNFLVEASNESNNNFNNTVKDFYERMYTTEEFPYRIQSNYMIRRWKDYIPVGKALDLGIGMGKEIEYLLSQGYQVIGVDFSEVSIGKLRKRYSNKKCTFINDDITHFDIQSSTYSLIICSLVLSHLSEKQVAALSKKIVNGLIPNGCLFINDLSDKDYMHKIESNSGLKRNYFTPEYLLDLFSDLEVIELSDSFIKEPKRIDYGGYFGLLNYIGRKK